MDDVDETDRNYNLGWQQDNDDMKSEKEETMADETSESPTEQKKEMEEGTEEHIIPEDFQRECMDYVSKLNRTKLDYLQNCCSKRSSELYKEENKDTEFSTKGMPE